MAAAVAVRTRTPESSRVGFPGLRRPNGSVVQQPPPAKRPRLDQLEKEKALELRKKHVAPSLGLHYATVKPIKVAYGRGQYLYDEWDQPYLDCINNVTHVGHCHPKVVAAGLEQMSKLVYLPDGKVTDTYTQHLLSTFPDNMGHVFYVHSGTEANDLALLIAETVTGNSEVIVIDGAYHGHSKPLMGLSSYKMKEKGNSGISPNPHAWIASSPDPFRGKYTDPVTAGTQYAEEIKETIDSMEKEGKKLACYVCESLPGCAGQVKLPDGYFKAVFDHVHRAGGLCIVDEVQTGFGRGGEFFWIFESQGVRPDIVTVGKPMGNGHPTAAVVTTKEIARDFLAKRPDLQDEYQGNPVSLAVAEAVLSVVEEEGLQAHAKELGGYMLSQLQQLASKHPCIGDVRGYGLFIGVEVTEGEGSKTPNTKLAKDIIAKMLLNDKILMMTDGLDNNVLKIKPPMCFTRANADSVLQGLDRAISDLTQ